MKASGTVMVCGLLGLLLVACGGTSLPAAPECRAPTPTPIVQNTFAAQTAYIRAVESGEAQLAGLLGDFRQRYPEGRFYRSADFREEWVTFAGASSCIAGDMERLTLPAESTPGELARDVELEALLDEYRRVLARGSEAVRQRNTSEYRDFNRAVDGVAARLQEWVDRGLQ